MQGEHESLKEESIVDEKVDKANLQAQHQHRRLYVQHEESSVLATNRTQWLRISRA
jgi:hypothetical protein